MVDAKATIYDIAKVLNLATSTVSRALNNDRRIGKRTRELVNKTAVDLNYRRNHIAAALRKGKSKILGVIVPRIDRAFFAEAVHGIEQVAHDAGYFVTICQSHESLYNEMLSVEALMEARVDGILLSCSKETTSFGHLQKVLDRNIPLVIFDRVNNEMDINMVSIDDFAGSYEATNHLIKQDYKRIAHLTLAAQVPIYEHRLSGYRQALIDANRNVDAELVIRNNLQLEDGVEAMKHLLNLPNPPDALFSSSALAAAGAAQYIKALSIEIPKDFGLIGFSDEPFTSLTDPPLSIVNQHSYRVGNSAAQLFLQQIDLGAMKIPRRIVIRPTLVIRQSSQR
jgi:LacI family transcriptional regulator